MVRLSLLQVVAVCTLPMMGCGDTGREHIVIRLEGRGTAARSVEVAGGTLRLTSAKVALGPVYLCATKSAVSELCETALAEFLETQTFDALSAQNVYLGELDGTTGTVQSGFFDYGISWPLTRQAPGPNTGAASGHSAVLTLEATGVDGRTLDVRIEVDVEPIVPGDAAVNGQKTRHALRRDGDAVTVVVDASAWLERVKFERLLEQDVDGDGQVLVAPGSQPYEAIVQGMTVNAPAGFVWGDSP